MYQQIQATLERKLAGRILGISGIENFYEMIDMNTSRLVEVQYPEVDMQDLPFQEAEFDVVISDQVLEHLPDPRKAVQESFRVLRIGGIAIHTTSFLNPIHEVPKDYWRLSKEGLAALCPPDAEPLQIGSWGNRIALGLLLLRDDSRFVQIPSYSGLRRLLATYNEDKYPIVTWMIAAKTGRER
jgi:SAM-dependent methyltransferase